MFSKIEYVYAVYKEKSFTKAADKLCVSQPYLSAAIKRIEQQIGASLFERKHASVLPTEIGYEYIHAAEQIMELERHFSAKVKDITEMELGQLDIGCSVYCSTYVIPQMLKEFSSLYPKIKISLMDAGDNELDEMLINEEIDFIIGTKTEDKKSYDALPLLTENILLAVPMEFDCNNGLEGYQIKPSMLNDKNFKLDSIPEISMDYFKNENFIVLKNGNDMYSQAQEIFNKNKFTPNLAFQLDILEASYALTVSGNGVCFVTDTMFKNKSVNDNIVLYRLKNATQRTVYLIKKKSKYTTNAIKTFIDTTTKTKSEKGELL